MDGKETLLEVKDLKTWFGSEQDPIRAVDGVTFTVNQGQTVALVGESGCGKSVTALSLARLVPEPAGFYAGGEIILGGRNVLKMRKRELESIRGREVAYVFQEPGTALNPVFRVGSQIMESIKLHQPDVNAKEKAIELMRMVGLPEPEKRMYSYPHEMSGGMQQRAMIAMALACKPRLLIADEPTTALDVTIQAQILELLVSLQKELGMAVLIITHNLGLVADVADYVNVMYTGRIVESGKVEDVLKNPLHPYSTALLQAVPRLERSNDLGDVEGIPGTVPNPSRLPKGCKFAPRCSYVQDKCLETEPDIENVKDNHCVRCYYPLKG